MRRTAGSVQAGRDSLQHLQSDPLRASAGSEPLSVSSESTDAGDTCMHTCMGSRLRTDTYTEVCTHMYACICYVVLMSD